MKVGDKVVCIKDRFSKFNNNHIINKSGNIYYISGFVNNDENFLYLSSEELNGYIYSIEEDYRYCYFNEYFIYLKEQRNQKLNKINLCSK